MGFSRKPLSFYFQEQLHRDHIGRKTVQSYLYAAGSNAVRFFINIASVSILARLLMPEDFGYVAMAAAFVSTPKMVTGQALSMGIIQSPKINPDQLNGFFWVCLGLTAVITGLSVACSPLVAWFFNEPILTDMVRMMSLMILFTGVCAIHYALLNRTMQFGVISGIDLISGILSKGVAVVLAVLGFGYWALVMLPVSHEGIRAVLLWAACSFKPKFRQMNFKGKSLLKLGSTLSVAGIITSFSNEMDRILIGKFLTPQMLGIYSRSSALGEMPGKFIAWPLGRIAVSALSRLQQDPKEFQRFFLLLTQAYFLLIIPVFVWAFVSGEAIVLLILGDNWQAAIPVFKILVFYFLFKNLARPFEWLLTATYASGTTARQIYVWTFSRNICFVAGVAAGLPWGVTGVAIAVAAAFLLFLLGSIYFFSSASFYESPAFARLLLKTGVPGLISLGAALLIIKQTALIHAFSHLIVICISFSLVFGVFFLSFSCIPGSRDTLKNMIRTLNTILNQRKLPHAAKRKL
jgi:PST family polysaccharide transporter